MHPLSPKTSDAESQRASTTALAFATYELVPYLGILLSGAVRMGGIGLISNGGASLGGRKASYAGLVFVS